MRYLVSILLLMATSVLVLNSCAKWHDPPPTTDPRLTNPYCNDPNAVNYNWGFPGKPDNTVCFYPNQLFAGSWMYYDTIYNAAGLIVLTDSMLLSIHSISDSVISVFGFCSASDSFVLKAGATYIATVDTVVGDSITTEGQLLCNPLDTISGSMTRDRIDSPYVIHMNLTVTSDTGTTTYTGSAIFR